MITIRIATIEDAEMIADLSQKTFYDSFAAFNSKENMDKFLNDQFTRELLVQEVGAANNIFLVANDDKDVVGYARLRENNIPPGLGTNQAIEIARIYAVRHSIGKGVGSALMKKCMDIAGEKGYHTVWLGVWEHNLRAIDFYNRWGFVKFGEHDFILGNDVQKDWLMKKDI